jgi:hypothetical protein
MNTTHHICQTAITLLSGSTVLLHSSTSRRMKRTAFGIGIMAQPFWFASGLRADQWGIMALACWFLFFNCRGWWTHRPKPNTWNAL